MKNKIAFGLVSLLSLYLATAWAENSTAENTPAAPAATFTEKTLPNGDVVKTITEPNGMQVVQTKHKNGTEETEIMAAQQAQPSVDSSTAG